MKYGRRNYHGADISWWSNVPGSAASKQGNSIVNRTSLKRANIPIQPYMARELQLCTFIWGADYISGFPTVLLACFWPSIILLTSGNFGHVSVRMRASLPVFLMGGSLLFSLVGWIFSIYDARQHMWDLCPNIFIAVPQWILYCISMSRLLGQVNLMSVYSILCQTSKQTLPQIISFHFCMDFLGISTPPTVFGEHHTKSLLSHVLGRLFNLYSNTLFTSLESVYWKLTDHTVWTLHAYWQTAYLQVVDAWRQVRWP